MALKIDPITRLEGHWGIEVDISGTSVVTANIKGTMFRGFEIILPGRNPRDATFITQRICGVCPTTHGMASCRCVENTFGIDDEVRSLGNARNLRNLIEGADLVMSHITHFYHLAAADFINFSGTILDQSGTVMSPWGPQYTDSNMVGGATANGLIEHYVSALEIRRKVHAAGALFSGKQPIQAASVVGGITKGNPETITNQKIETFRNLMNQARNFINTVYIPDVVFVATSFTGFWNVGTGCKNYLAYGAFDLDANGTKLLKTGVLIGGISGSLDNSSTDQAILASRIREGIMYSKYVDDTYGGSNVLKSPFDGVTDPYPNAPNTKYSWVKAPRYISSGGATTVCEVGPLARMLVTYKSDATEALSQLGAETNAIITSATYTIKGMIDTVINAISNVATFPGALMSVLGRHAARALECKAIADAMVGTATYGSITSWLDQLNLFGEQYYSHQIPRTTRSGYGLTEAPRGALGHWMKISRGKISHYQCVVPTTWNGSPKWGSTTGAAEQAVMDTPVGSTTAEQVLNIIRTIHSFDFCGACAMHLNTPNGKIKVVLDPDGKVVKTEVEK